MGQALRGWKKWCVIGVAVLVAFAATAFSLARVMAAHDPARAHQLAPGDGRITAALATMLDQSSTAEADRQRADTLARLALRQDPTAVAAIATLGGNAEARGDVATARRLFTFAQKLSRRDLRTQMWMIEDKVRQGDVAGSLHEYDTTLRVFPRLSDLLYPILAAASTEPAIRTGLLGILRPRPAWSESFLLYIAASGPDPHATVALLTSLARAGISLPSAARASAVNALLAKGDAEGAWTYFAAIHPGADRRSSRDPAFAEALAARSQFDWMTTEEGPIDATLQKGLFDFAAPASVGGAVLQQFQMLPPGSYRLSGHSIGIDQPAATRPYWRIACQGGREAGRLDMPASASNGGAFAGVFTIPKGCPIQILTLIVRPSDAVDGSLGQIDRVQLRPIEQRSRE